MKIMTTWKTPPEHNRQVIARFLETGGGPPAGITMLGRWHGAGCGFVLAETDDVKAIYKWTGEWADLLEFTVTPVMEDAEAAEVLRSLTK